MNFNEYFGTQFASKFFKQWNVISESTKEQVHDKKLENVPLLEDFNCKLCSKVFTTKDILLNHEESVHTENVPLLKEFTYLHIVFRIIHF